MIDEVIRITKRESDLERTAEFWQSHSYEERSREIVDSIVRLKGGPPSPNMTFIREGVFSIASSTTLEDLRALAVEIRQQLVIDAFQISIDRDCRECHMLFDWYDRDQERSYHLYAARKRKLSVLIMRRIGTLDDLVSDNWVRQYLLQEHKEVPNILERAEDFIIHNVRNRRLYLFLLMSLRHVSNLIRHEQMLRNTSS